MLRCSTAVDANAVDVDDRIVAQGQRRLAADTNARTGARRARRDDLHAGGATGEQLPVVVIGASAIFAATSIGATVFEISALLWAPVTVVTTAARENGACDN